MPRVDGPFRVLEKVNDNAYKLDLPEGYNVSPTFNMHDLSPYLEDGIGIDDGVDLRASPFQQKGDDVPHHGTGKEEFELEDLMEQRECYKGPITCCRATLVNLITYMDGTEVCEVPGAVTVCNN